MFPELIGYLKLNWLESDIYLQNNTPIKRLDLINNVRVCYTHICTLSQINYVNFARISRYLKYLC